MGKSGGDRKWCLCGFVCVCMRVSKNKFTLGFNETVNID